MPSDAAGPSFDLARLRDGLKPFRLHWFPRLGSTNTHAAVLRDRGTLFAPAVVLTGRQLAGRGRGSHRWWSPTGCLTVTFVLPTDPDIEPHQVPLLAGLAVRRAAAASLGQATTTTTRTSTPLSAGVRLKWPNDVQHDGRKLAGLLCERVMKVDLVGVGLNVNVDPADAPPDIRPTLTSLAGVAGRPFDMTDVLITVAAELRQVMRERTQHPFGVLLKEYDEHHALIGRRVSVLDAGDGQAVNGKCEGLDEMGRLLVRDRQRLHRVIAGQVVAR